MPQAYIRFYEELNDFLPSHCRKKEFSHTFRDQGSIKDLIESLGVPHTEIDLIMVNGVSVDFSYLVRDKDRISVYPVFESLDISSLVRLRPKPLRETKFVVDVHLGRLARWLRMLGFDTSYYNDYAPNDLVRLSLEEKRIVLTRSRGLLKRRAITHGYWVRAAETESQAREVVERFDLAGSATPFTRCLDCNGMIEKVDKAAVLHVLPKRSGSCYDEFYHCVQCRKPYWPGSHFHAMKEKVEKLLTPKK